MEILIGMNAMPKNGINDVTLDCAPLKVLESDFLKFKSQMNSRGLVLDQNYRILGSSIGSNVIEDYKKLLASGLNSIFAM